ncbi:hypothetical protein KAK06_13945 [Ideonella sp. 4Y11]|uniref:DUF3455 domain-containing protein n=1 Tax=Ideonella aquatica TaxID=2824119 RepID=A0A940YL98_9BURK|nr:hypothetical protein [Ideonella aquatica]MBQ0960051.1 hypothetical protein [Ideonella aquatica]
MRPAGWALLAATVLASAAQASAAAPAAALWPDATEHWVASSTTALSITGPVQVSGRRLVFGNGAGLALEGPAPSVSFADQGERVQAAVLRVSGPADPVLLNKNRLCGSAAKPRAVTYIALWRPEPLSAGESPRAMAAFSGERAPASTADPSLCGIYYYERR